MIKQLLEDLTLSKIQFKDVLDYIEQNYHYQPSGFKNGAQYNAESENQGSARVFSLAQLEGLSKEDTLQLFAEHYVSVLATPEGADHQNIRQFMLYGWDGLSFDRPVLRPK